MLHTPVLLREVTHALRFSALAAPRLLDLTLGAGGYAAHFLASHPRVKVVATDRDVASAPAASALAARFGADRFEARVPCRWSDLDVGDGADAASLFDGVVMDLGMCRTQMDDHARGFSFRAAGPDSLLDMRMGGAPDAPTAAHVLNTWTEQELTQVFFELAEQPVARAKALAAATVRGRPWSTVKPFADMVRGERTALVPKSIDPATLPFQALRMVVNDEVGQLACALERSQRWLRPGGHLVVVSYHSIEDRMVKKFMRYTSRPHSVGLPEAPASFRDTAFDLVRPSAQEVAANPRSSSALLRCVQRTDAPPLPVADALKGIAVKRLLGAVATQRKS